MNCCNNSCRQGRDCPERLAQIREAKRRLESGERECRSHWSYLTLFLLAATLIGWVASLIREALA